LFEVLKTPLIRGRFFDDRDIDAPVAIVSQTLVDDHFAGTDPVGQHIRLVEDGAPWLTVVGVVGTWKHLVNDASWRDTSGFSPSSELTSERTGIARSEFAERRGSASCRCPRQHGNSET
jgi:hypothetical protein